MTLDNVKEKHKMSFEETGILPLLRRCREMFGNKKLSQVMLF